MKTILATILSCVAVFLNAHAFETSQAVTATAITSVPFTISTPGNYYLPNDLVSTSPGVAITVNADEVIIDLNGRSLIANGAAASPNVGIGIAVLNHQDCVIQHGDINHFGAYGVLLDGTDRRREHNQKNDVLRVNFNNDQIGVVIVSGSIDEVENCNFDGGSVGIEDIASLGGDRFQADNFEHQRNSEALQASIGLIASPGAGVLVEDCLFAAETTGVILQGAQDKVRMDSFVSVTTHRVGGTEEFDGDL